MIILLVSFDHAGLQIASIILIIFSILVAVFLVFIVEIKTILGKFANSYISNCFTTCWIFVIIPFCVLIPFILAQNSSKSTLGQLLQISILFVFFLIMIAVTVFSILLNYIKINLKYFCTLF